MLEFSSDRFFVEKYGTASRIMELYQKEVNVTVRRQVVFVLFPVFKTVWQLPVRDDKFG